MRVWDLQFGAYLRIRRPIDLVRLRILIRQRVLEGEYVLDREDCEARGCPEMLLKENHRNFVRVFVGGLPLPLAHLVEGLR